MQATQSQIERAKSNYTNFLVIRSVDSFEPEFKGWAAAEQSCEFHNKTINSILGGNKELEREWKMFFLNEQIKLDRKYAEQKSKLAANKEASADILAPIKSAKKLVEFGKWLNTPNNQFRKEHFSKKYTQASVNTFLQSL